MMPIRKQLPLILAVVLSACQSAPPPVTAPTVQHIQEAVPDVADVTYVAQDMLPGRQRGAATIYGSLPGRDSAGISPATSTLGGGTIAAAAGQSPLSSGGVGTAVYAGAGLAVAGALLDSTSSDGPHNAISGVYLPREVDGRLLATADEAREFVRAEALRGLDAFAHETGRVVVCVDQCNGFFPTYDLRKSAGGPTFPYFDPLSLFVSLYIRPLKDATTTDNPVLNKALGFTPAWHGGGTNGFMVCLNDYPPVLQKTVTEDGESVNLYACTVPAVHSLERRLFRSLTAGGHTYLGVFAGAIFAWHGRVFALGDRDPKTLIKYEISPSTDAPRGD